MARRSSRRLFWDVLDRVTIVGLQVGGIAFGLVSLYLIWGMATGSLAHTYMLPAADQKRIVENIIIACRILVISGAVLGISLAIRYYREELTGYGLFVGGAVLRWGIPMLVGPSFELGSPSASLPAYIISGYSTLGTLFLVVSVPFIVYDFWYKLRGGQSRAVRDAATVLALDDDIPSRRINFFCWQMPFCRSYLRRHCDAFAKRSSCWRIKSGCYCDENMILRVMKRSATSKLPGYLQTYSSVADKKSKDLTPAQKRQRCRQCFIYQEHQKMKYRVLSPLTFPAGIGIMWLYFQPIRTALNKGLEITDEFAGRLAFTGPGYDNVMATWASAPATSSAVEWMFIVCLGLVVITYLIRALEYFVFDLQV